MREPFVARDKACEFDVAALIGDVSGKSGFVCLSEPTWELAYNLVQFYGFWRSRYYHVDVDGSMLTITDEEFDQVSDLVENAIAELRMTGCEQLTEAVLSLVEQFTFLNEKVDTMNTTLANIETAIETIQAQDITEQVDDVEEILDGINVILGGAAILAG